MSLRIVGDNFDEWGNLKTANKITENVGLLTLLTILGQ